MFKYVATFTARKLMIIKQKVMKSQLFFIAIFFLFAIQGFTEPVDKETALAAAGNKLMLMGIDIGTEISPNPLLIRDGSGRLLCYLFELNPAGYVAVTADTDLPPVIAYSFTNSWFTDNPDQNPLLELLEADLTDRFENLSEIPGEIIQQRNQGWDRLLKNPQLKAAGKFEQWPPAGTTPTGGWLESNWTQSPPYNNFCPMDPVTNQRSVAGCPAVAMAMILNYYETVNGTEFNDAQDDYYHSYAGRNYWIDDDYIAIDFPCFPDLNAYLDTLTQCYATQTPLKASEKAALTFACGVAATQVYTSSISGTFGVNQAFDAYMRFGFQEALLMDENDTAIYTILSKNMKEARPAHLAVVDPGWTMGHNVVVDGYNTDDYYHLNFGWGGSYNGWYLLPEEIPYGLTVIEGVIVNIAYPPVNTGFIENPGKTESLSVTIFPNPASGFIRINFNQGFHPDVQISLYDVTGNYITNLADERITDDDVQVIISLEGKNLSPGLYFILIESDGGKQWQKIVKQ
jgi:hypothetical protein